MFLYLVPASGILLTVIFLFFRKPVVKPQTAMLKSLCSAFFVFTVIAGLLYNKNATPGFAALMVCGGVFGIFGDIWLDLKYVYKSDSAEYLKAGFISFLIGHIFYSSAFALNFNIKPLHLLIALAGGVGVALITAFTENVIGVYYGGFKKLTVTYMFFLGFTVFLSLACALSCGFTLFSILVCLGMIFFIASDVVLSGIYFGEGKCTRFNVVLNHSLYYTGQYLLAISLFFAQNYRG